ncbi:MAG: RidA family protein [Proteobacteria bacterium]|jgi:reactive intermediate/imine deaminase|nr:RidA family protein [Pseudomonadota bacterium]MBT5817021.1 RidA family protein [Pseudomonadota bacterium]MBT6348248.1 RidA family protein [Pseudomonadota bacterium]|tara:strand:- start:85 stop:483 length:399 start_codon:yes stop_codon:yes gene_type:complete
MNQDPVFHNFDEAPTHVAPFSHAVEVDGWIQLTGQMPTDPDDDSAPLPPGVEAQTRRVMDNLIIVLNGLELDLSHVLSCRVYLTEFARDYEVMNQTYRSYFLPGRLPARTCIGVTGLAREALVEIDMVAKRA